MRVRLLRVPRDRNSPFLALNIAVPDELQADRTRRAGAAAAGCWRGWRGGGVLSLVAACPELVAGCVAGGGTGLLAYVDVVYPGPKRGEAREWEGDGSTADVKELLAGEGHLGRGKGEGYFYYGVRKRGRCRNRGWDRSGIVHCES